MRVGTRGHYAILALLDLVMHGEEKPVRLTDIALRQNLPLPYLEQLFNLLKNQGVVTSHRGRWGGYVLALPADQTPIDKILQAVDEDVRARHCDSASDAGCRGRQVRCLTHVFWEHLEDHIQSYLSAFTLADVTRMQQGGAERRVEPCGVQQI